MGDSIKSLQELLEKRGYKNSLDRGDTIYSKEVGKIVLLTTFPKNDREVWMRVLTEDELFGSRKRTQVCYIEDFEVEDWKLPIVYDSILNKLYKDLCLELQQLYIKEFEATV